MSARADGRPKFPYKTKGRDGVGVFGTRLKNERIRRGWQLRMFADFCDVNVSQILKYENHGTMPSLIVVMRIAKVLDCSIDWLVGMED
jgi:transcriptional regulator with XRE-family HTH domain